MPRIDRTSRLYQHAVLRPQPLAESIAAEIIRHRDILNLRTDRLVSDIRERFGCAYCTAMAALEIARNS